jgi:Fic family protein
MYERYTRRYTWREIYELYRLISPASMRQLSHTIITQFPAHSSCADHRSRNTVGNAKIAKKGRQMDFHCPLSQVEAVCNFLIGLAADQKLQHLPLTRS